MGIVGDAINDMFDKIGDFIAFFVTFTVVVFVLGEVFGTIYKGTELAWYPVYLLCFVLLWGLMRGFRKKKK